MASWGSRLGATLGLLAAGLVGGHGLADGAAEPNEVERGTGASRLPAGSAGGDYWELVFLSESGHLVFAQTLLTRLGWGGPKAALVGAIVEPRESGGRVRHFRRSENEGGYTLSDDRRSLDLQAAALEQEAGSRRLRARKSGLRIALEIDARASGLPIPAAPEDCPMGLLDLASPARGSFEPRDGSPRIDWVGRAAVTHRWLDRLESDCATRRLELFVLDTDLGVYFSEVLTPTGELLRFAAVDRAGEAVFAGPPERVEIDWGGEAGEPMPSSLELDLPDLALRVSAASEPALEMDLLDRVPGIFRRVIALRTRPSVRLSRASFEASGPAGTREGPALVKVLYLNPLP